MAQKRAHPASIPETFHSSKLVEQTSSFIGVFSPTLSAPALQHLPEFRTATHRIAAWRKPSRQTSLTPGKPLFDTHHDDDGESWAGGRLARVLDDTQAEGSVVVARWYGGQNIGPVRFACIERCAKEAIWKWKVAVGGARGEEQQGKRQRVDEEARRGELVKELAERDRSIVALRRLLAEKKARLSGEEVAPGTPLRVSEYGKMGMDVLKRLDKARDATIAAILKQMDKVDEELRAVEELVDDVFDELADDALDDALDVEGQSGVVDDALDVEDSPETAVHEPAPESTTAKSSGRVEAAVADVDDRSNSKQDL